MAQMPEDITPTLQAMFGRREPTMLERLASLGKSLLVVMVTTAIFAVIVGSIWNLVAPVYLAAFIPAVFVYIPLHHMFLMLLALIVIKSHVF